MQQSHIRTATCRTPLGETKMPPPIIQPTMSATPLCRWSVCFSCTISVEMAGTLDDVWLGLRAPCSSADDRRGEYDSLASDTPPDDMLQFALVQSRSWKLRQLRDAADEMYTASPTDRFCLDSIESLIELNLRRDNNVKYLTLAEDNKGLPKPLFELRPKLTNDNKLWTQVSHTGCVHNSHRATFAQITRFRATFMNAPAVPAGYYNTLMRNVATVLYPSPLCYSGLSKSE